MDSPESLNRRRFIQLTAGSAIGAYVLGGCGTYEQNTTLSSSLAEQISGINDPAIATQQAVRGGRIQLTPVPPPPQTWQSGDFITHVNVSETSMAFTFDDGPSPYNTEDVLRTLAKNGIKASFYLVGVNVRAYPDIARRIANEGHELGNHSVYHTPYEAGALSRQVAPNQEIIRSETGILPVTNRMPGLTRGDSVLPTCAQNGLYEAHTNMNTTDWKSPRVSANSLIDEFNRVIRPGGIGLYHDGGNRRPTPDALEGMILIAKSRGYKFYTATELVNSGVPQPGTPSYRISSAENIESTNSDTLITCNYNARDHLEKRLEDPTVKLSERSRIVEILAEYDEL